jgi:hypothetical protein
MQIPLTGWWQISPLTDLSIPQADIQFPGPLSQVLPETLSEQMIAEQEWHLMYDIEVDEAMLAYPAVDLVLEGIDYFAEVRLNGEAIFDCDGSELTYRKDIKRYLQQGRNRFEILFLEQEVDWLLDADDQNDALSVLPRQRDPRIGIWQLPYLQFVQNIRLDHISIEQVWHHSGVCEFRVDLFYQVYSTGLIAATVQLDGLIYQVPLDVRFNQASAIFQIEAPLAIEDNGAHFYLLSVALDGQKRTHQVRLRRTDANQRNSHTIEYGRRLL